MLTYNKPFIFQRADPYVVKADDGYYYFTASVPAYDGIILRRSRTLEGLTGAQEIYVWHRHASGPQSIHIWAPELHKLFGGWYIYYAAGDKDDIWNIRPYVLRCRGENPYEDTWEELGPMKACEEDEFSFTQFSLDATVFENNGKQYLVWAEKVGSGRQISNLYIAKMAAPDRLATRQVLLSTPDYEWERHGFWVNEGPSVLRHEGRIYLTYSASDTGPAYCVGMLSADEKSNLLDPGSWKKNREPVLASCPKYSIFGPGHDCFTEDERGNTILVYHARTKPEIEGDPLYNPNRHTMLMKVRWDEKGEPVFSLDEKEGSGKKPDV